MVSIKWLEVLLNRFLCADDIMQHSNDDFDALISPHELSGGVGDLKSLMTRVAFVIEDEAKFLYVQFQLLVGNAAIEIFVHLPHYFKDLLLRDREAQSLQEVLELITLNETILVRVDLVEYFSKRQRFLLEYLHQVIKYFELNICPLLLLLDVFQRQFIVMIVEFLKFLILNDAILIAIDLLEQLQKLVPLQ